MAIQQHQLCPTAARHVRHHAVEEAVEAVAGQPARTGAGSGWGHGRGWRGSGRIVAHEQEARDKQNGPPRHASAGISDLTEPCALPGVPCIIPLHFEQHAH